MKRRILFITFRMWSLEYSMMIAAAAVWPP